MSDERPWEASHKFVSLIASGEILSSLTSPADRHAVKKFIDAYVVLAKQVEGLKERRTFHQDRILELEAERDEYVHEAEHFQNKCINLDQANGLLNNIILVSESATGAMHQATKIKELNEQIEHLEELNKDRLDDWKRIQDAERMVEQLKAERDDWKEKFTTRTHAHVLQEKLDIATEALEVYARNEGLRINHQTNKFESSDCDDGVDFHGHKAREALAKIRSDSSDSEGAE